MRRTALLVTVALVACGGDDPTTLPQGTTIEVAFSGLRALDPADGTLAVWVVVGTDTVPGGTVTFATQGSAPGPLSHSFAWAGGSPQGLFVTVEPPGDTDGRPSAYVMMDGVFSGSKAELDIIGSVTAGVPFEPDPGAHSLFTSSNNPSLGWPSLEDAGIWLFNIRPKLNKHGTREVKVAQIRPEWVYQGWVVFHHGRPDAVWIPYGKFRPDFSGLLTSRDDTGSGPFSGDEDFINGGIEDVPGDEWTTDVVARELGFSLPAGLVVPLDLDAVDPITGKAEWTHVMTLEPSFNEVEAPLEGRPFLIRPYRNPIGAGGPGEPRFIQLVEEGPTAVASIRP